MMIVSYGVYSKLHVAWINFLLSFFITLTQISVSLMVDCPTQLKSMELGRAGNIGSNYLNVPSTRRGGWAIIKNGSILLAATEPMTKSTAI